MFLLREIFKKPFTEGGMSCSGAKGRPAHPQLEHRGTFLQFPVPETETAGIEWKRRCTLEGRMTEKL